MNFQIKSSLKGCAIEHEGHVFSYESKLFSMSGNLRDNSGNILAEMKRIGWWNYRFEIKTEYDNYNLLRKWGNTKLVLESHNLEYETNRTTEFYIKGSKHATKFKLEKCFANTCSLEIIVTEHWQALLLASCFIHRLDIQDS